MPPDTDAVSVSDWPLSTVGRDAAIVGVPSAALTVTDAAVEVVITAVVALSVTVT